MWRTLDEITGVRIPVHDVDRHILNSRMLSSAVTAGTTAVLLPLSQLCLCHQALWHSRHTRNESAKSSDSKWWEGWRHGRGQLLQLLDIASWVHVPPRNWILNILCFSPRFRQDEILSPQANSSCVVGTRTLSLRVSGMIPCSSTRCSSFLIHLQRMREYKIYSSAVKRTASHEILSRPLISATLTCHFAGIISNLQILFWKAMTSPVWSNSKTWRSSTASMTKTLLCCIWSMYHSAKTQQKIQSPLAWGEKLNEQGFPPLCLSCPILSPLLQKLLAS